MDSPDFMDSPSHDRNPSPPPELAERNELLDAESIGNTAFSKHWLFTTLMKLIEEVDRENEEETDLMVDVDDDLQNELCKLWDMSMNSDVVKFLYEFKAVDILTGIVQKSKAPRVTEICVGILGNMACEQTVCKHMADNHKFIDMMLLLLETRDAPILVENTRLIYTSLSNTGTRGNWIMAIQRSEDVLDHLKFIFSSSTNCDLLKNTAELVDTLLDLEPDLCVSWATIDFINSLLEATAQIGSNHSEALEVYFHIFQSFSTTESGVEALVSHRDRLEQKVMKYLNIVCEYEIVSVDQKEAALTSALSILHILLTTRPREQTPNMCKDERLMRILLKILEPLYPMLQRYRAENQTTSVQLSNGTQDDHVTSSDQSNDQNGNETKELTKCAENIDVPKTEEPVSKFVENQKVESKQVSSKEETSSAENEPVGDLVETAGDASEAVVEVKETVDVNSDRTPDDVEQLETLYEILSGFLLDYCNTIFMQQGPAQTEIESTAEEVDSSNNASVGEQGQSEGANECESTKEDNSADISMKGDNSALDDKKETEDSDDSKGDNLVFPCLPVLTYLDEACSRCRINFLGLALKETETGSQLFTMICELAKTHDKQRLDRVLNDVVAGKIVNRADSSKTAEEIIS